MTRRANDENAVPAPTLRNKPSSSALGPPQKVGAAVTATKHVAAAASNKGVRTKRPALGGVAGNVAPVKEEALDEKKPGKLAD